MGERRCVHAGDSLPDLSVRSGEMIVRGARGLVAADSDKMLWMGQELPTRSALILDDDGFHLVEEQLRRQPPKYANASSRPLITVAIVWRG